MVCGIKQFVGEVEEVLLIRAGFLNLSSDGIEVDIAGNHIVSCVLLTAGSLQEPAAHLHAFPGGGGGTVDVKCADGLVFLTGGSAENGLLVGVDIGQGVVGLLSQCEHILYRGLAEAHRDGDHALGIVAHVADDPYLTLLGLGLHRIGLAHHLYFLREFHLCLVGIVEDLLGGELLTVDGQRGEDGYFLLLATECSLDDNIGEADLLGSLQVIEVDEQSAGAFAWGGTLDVVRQLGHRVRVVVTIGLHAYGQRNGGLVGILP